MKNIMMTGGAGFIGSNFIHYLLRVEPDAHIVNIDALTYAGSQDNLKDISEDNRYTFVHGDIGNGNLIEKLFREYKIDTVVHFAAESHVDRSILDPGQFIQTNINGTFTLLQAARKVWLQESALPVDGFRFHHISTDEVFGSLAPAEPAWIEASPYAPNSPYAASKASADHLVRAFGHTYGLPYTLTNCSNNYGPYQFPEKLIPLTILNAIEGKRLPVYGDGQQIRDWLHVEDHCDAIYQVLKRGASASTYNIGGENQPANFTIVEMICEILDGVLPDSENVPHKSLIEFVKDRPGHDRRYAMDIQKINQELGWKPRYSLKEGLRDTIAWYLSHADWVAAIRNKREYQGWLDHNYRSR